MSFQFNPHYTFPLLINAFRMTSLTAFPYSLFFI